MAVFPSLSVIFFASVARQSWAAPSPVTGLAGGLQPDTRFFTPADKNQGNRGKISRKRKKRIYLPSIITGKKELSHNDI
jgi:hypothetical protein